MWRSANGDHKSLREENLEQNLHIYGGQAHHNLWWFKNSFNLWFGPSLWRTSPQIWNWISDLIIFTGDAGILCAQATKQKCLTCSCPHIIFLHRRNLLLYLYEIYCWSHKTFSRPTSPWFSPGKHCLRSLKQLNWTFQTEAFQKWK